MCGDYETDNVLRIMGDDGRPIAIKFDIEPEPKPAPIDKALKRLMDKIAKGLAPAG